eukprot:gene23981-29028_t
MNFSLAPSFSVHIETHHAADTEATAKINFNDNGCCVHHPDILLRKKKIYAVGVVMWKVIQPECPRCAAEWKVKYEKERKIAGQSLLPQAPRLKALPSSSTAVALPPPPPASTVSKRNNQEADLEELANQFAVVHQKYGTSIVDFLTEKSSRGVIEVFNSSCSLNRK